MRGRSFDARRTQATAALRPVPLSDLQLLSPAAVIGSNGNAEEFLVALEQTRRRFQLRVYGYVVMPEHVHLLMSEPADGLLPKAMQMLKSRVSIQARRAGKRAAGSAPFWQIRYFDHNVRNYEGFVTQLRYIHRNPVKRKLCAAPEDWPWSSFRAWALGESGTIEVESEMMAARREMNRSGSPAMREPVSNEKEAGKL